MQPRESENGNQVYPDLPELAEPHFVYREARWVDYGLRGLFVLMGVGLLYLAVIMLSKNGFTWLMAACLLAAVTFIVGAIQLRRTDDSICFIVTRAGLFFPENKLFARRSGLWLFVPWRNVLEYHVQLLFDETSTRGIAMAVVANSSEEKWFFSGRRIYGAAVQRSPVQSRTILVGFSTFLPRPEDVLLKLRTYDGLQRADDADTELAFATALPDRAALT